MADPIPHNRPLITEDDRTAVMAVLQSHQLAEGPKVRELESAFCAMLGGGGAACAVSSGTAALLLALKGLGLAPGEAVAVPTYTCSALLNAVFSAGGVPRAVDVRRDNYTIDPSAVARQAPDARIVIAVHCFGATADIPALKRMGRVVIEDCCQSLGGPQGHEGDAAIFSFYATKIITGGQGGLVWDARGTVAAAARDYREFDGRETYVPRFNLQMTDMQAAMIGSQLGRLAHIRARRQEIYRKYRGALPHHFDVQKGVAGDAVLPYRFIVEAKSARERDALRSKMTTNSIATILPVERFELLHRYLGLEPTAYPVGEELADCALSLPLYPALSDADADAVCGALKDAA